MWIIYENGISLIHKTYYVSMVVSFRRGCKTNKGRIRFQVVCKLLVQKTEELTVQKRQECLVVGR